MKEAGADRDTAGTGGQRLVVGSVLAATFVVNMGVQYLSPVLPALARGLHLSAVQLGAVVSAYSFAALALTLPAGYLADRVGVRRVLAGALILFGVGGLAVGLSPSFPVLLASRIVQGFGVAAVIPVTIAALADLAPGGRLARLQGYRVSVSSTAEFVLPVMGGFLVGGGGAWRIAFIPFVVPVVLGIVVWRVFPEPVRPPRPITERHRPSYAGQLRKSFRDGRLVALFGAGLVRWWIKYALFTYLPLYLSEDLHAQGQVIGLVIGVQGLLSGIVASQAGRLGTQRAGRRSLAVALLVMGAALASETVVHALWWPILMCCIVGLADGVVGPLLNTFVSLLPARDVRTAIIAMAGTLRNVGKAAAPVAVGALVVTLGYGPALALAGSLGLAAPLYLCKLLVDRPSDPVSIADVGRSDVEGTGPAVT